MKACCSSSQSSTPSLSLSSLSIDHEQYLCTGFLYFCQGFPGHPATMRHGIQWALFFMSCHKFYTDEKNEWYIPLVIKLNQSRNQTSLTRGLGHIFLLLYRVIYFFFPCCCLFLSEMSYSWPVIFPVILM